MIDRRDFLRLGAGAALGLSVGEALARENAAAPTDRIARYVRLGRTDLKVSDISFGSASSADPALVTHALARGVNYFDTAESYKWGNAEEAIGEALRGKRNDVVLSTKTKAGASDTSADMMKALDAQPAPAQDRSRGHLFQSRGERRRSHAQSGIGVNSPSSPSVKARSASAACPVTAVIWSSVWTTPSTTISSM